MGFKKKDITASRTLKVRVTPDDEQAIRSRAAQSCLSVSDYVRRCAIGRRVDTRYDVDAILALREVVTEIRALRADPRIELSDAEIRAALQSAVDAMERV
ncbi:hypothetical protein [Burkholderia sp. LMG 13014]|uniref:plasmid mobilization protein n=1 Tax=Burkholderia sp. LMG 13014 TaxID=2709306 RepID=UPI001964DBD4|nr:hypothetical protein [Burkholderia sp. LMG 13014]